MYTSKSTLDLKPSLTEARAEHGDNLPPRDFVPLPSETKLAPQPPKPPKRKRSGKKHPQSKAPPRSIMLPFLRISDEVANKNLSYVETDSFTRNNIMRMLRRRKADLNVPGWLVQVSDARLNALMDIQKALKEVPDREALIATLSTITNNQMGFVVPKEEIIDAIEAVEDSKGGIPFSRFIFALANLKFARKSGALNPSMKRGEASTSKQTDYQVGDIGQPHAVVGDTQKPAGKKLRSKKQGPKSVASAGSSSQDAGEPTGFSEREKVFYSGLLVIQMSETLENVEQLYFQSYIPEPPQKTAKSQAKRGFGVESIGVKKIGQSEWERVLPVPKYSPYLTEVPFVTARWKVTKPNQDEKGRRRTLNQLYPLHLTVLPPEPEPAPHGIEFHGSIRITENRHRIKQVLEYLAYSKGDPIALLPGIHHLIHLSDTFVDELEEVKTKPTKTDKPRPVNVGRDVIYIGKDALALYNLYGVPKIVANVKNHMKYTTAIELRKLSERFQDAHWGYIKGRAMQFAWNCWEKMDTDRIKDGLAKQAFINTFLTYLPHAPRLPVSNLENPNPI